MSFRMADWGETTPLLQAHGVRPLLKSGSVVKPRPGDGRSTVDTAGGVLSAAAPPVDYQSIDTPLPDRYTHSAEAARVAVDR